MSDEKTNMCMPCDPASTRRSLVPGPEGEKWATEGDGGAASQALPNADATGPRKKTTAALQLAPGPVQKSTHEAVRRRGRRRSVAIAQEAAEQGAAVTGNGRELGQLNPAQSLYRGLSRRAQRRQRRARETELVDQCHRLRREGTLHLPGMAALAPPVVACMTRVVPPMPPPATVATPGPSSTAEASAGQRSEPQGRQLTPGPVPQVLPLNFITTHVACGPAALDSGTPPTVTDSTPCPSKGKGKGKGKKGSVGTERAVAGTVVPNTDTSHSGEEDVTNRGAKRQRSSDLVSPTCATVDKKICHRNRTAAVFSPSLSHDVLHQAPVGPLLPGSGGLSAADLRDGARPLSYAGAVGSYHRVVVLDRLRVPMDEFRAMCIRMAVDRASYGAFLEGGGRADTRLPQFMALPKLFRGGVRYTPRDDYALAWLTTTIEQLPALWQGSDGCMVVPESKVPRYYTAVIYVPDFGRGLTELTSRPDLLINFLVALNPGVGVERWQVFTHEVRPVGEARNHLLVVGISPEDVDLLRRVDFRLHYICARVYVKVRGYNTTGGGGSLAALEVGGTGNTASSSQTVPTAPNVDDNTPPTEMVMGWTREEEERLLDAGDECAGDLDLMGLNIFSPASSMDTDRTDHSRVNPST